MLKGLFINNTKAQDSIYESGLMVYEVLRSASLFSIDYTEVNAERNVIPTGYAFYLLNYHPSTMRWLDTRCIRHIKGLKMTMVLEVLPNDPFVLCPEGHFDAYIVLDPTLRHKNKHAYAFPRPLETVDHLPAQMPNEMPVIGTFGFATKGKGFQHVVEAVNKEFDRAIVKINIPYGDYVPDSQQHAKFLAELCKSKAKPGIEVVVTHDYMEKQQLIEWCAANTLNCFLYDRDMPGLAATTDQAIVARRPLSVSDNPTFRHIHTYIPPYPKLGLKEAIARSMEGVDRMNIDWSPEQFRQRFSMVIDRYPELTAAAADGGTFTLRHRGKGVGGVLYDRYMKYKKLLTVKRMRQLLAERKRRSKNDKVI